MLRNYCVQFWRQIRDLQREKASEAIRALYRMDRLGIVRAGIDRLIAEEQERSSATTKTQTKQGLKALATKRDSAKEKLAELRRTQNKLETQRSSAQERINELEKAIREHMQQDQDFRGRVNDLELKKKNLEIELVDIAKRTLAELRNPASIHPRILERLSDLGQKMQRLRLPKTMSMEFFNELALQPECVCGRTIGSTEREAILARANDYLSEDQIGVVNAIKSAVRQYKEGNTNFDDRAKRLKQLIADKHRLNGDWDRLEAERVAMRGKPDCF